MKIFYSVIGVFLFGVVPILSYYVKDDNPKAGYVSVQNSGRSYERRGFRGMQRRHFAGSSYKNKNENIVDSHFKVKKTPPYVPYSSVENRRGEVQATHWNTEAPIHRQTPQNKEMIEDTVRQQEPVEHGNQRGRSVDKTMDTQPLSNAQRSRPINAEYRPQLPQRSQNVQIHNNNYQDIQQNRYNTNNQMHNNNYEDNHQKKYDSNNQMHNNNYQNIHQNRYSANNQMHSNYNQNKYPTNNQMHSNYYQDIRQNRYEKPNLVEMNVHKTQISTDPQKFVRLNNNHQITSISLHQPDDKYEKIPTSAVVDKTLQKVSTHSDRNSKIMSRVLDEMTHKISDRRYKGEYRKRDTEYNARNYDMDKVNRNSISDTMRKYIVGKDKTINLERKSTKGFSRIGSHEDSIEPEESPYAIFYRMHPDTLDDKEGYISMGSMEDNPNVFTNKKKRLSLAYTNEVDLNKTNKRPKNNNVAVKIHKKVKNFFNFHAI